MILTVVKLKCSVLVENFNTHEMESKKISTSLILRNSETIGFAEMVTAKYFGEKASPENNYSITGLSFLNVQEVLVLGSLEQEVLGVEEENLLWFKIKVQLSGEGKPFTNLYLVKEINMERAQDRIRNTFVGSTLECSFKTSGEVKVIDYLELDEAKDESIFEDPELIKKDESSEVDFENDDFADDFMSQDFTSPKDPEEESLDPGESDSDDF